MSRKKEPRSLFQMALDHMNKKRAEPGYKPGDSPSPSHTNPVIQEVFDMMATVLDCSFEELPEYINYPGFVGKIVKKRLREGV